MRYEEAGETSEKVKNCRLCLVKNFNFWAGRDVKSLFLSL